MKRYTVNELAKLAGISVRTVHHYDHIGILKPAFVGHNSYRYYQEAELYQLQQILLYREIGLGLSEIAAILNDPHFDTTKALQEHRHRLVSRMAELKEIVETIDKTLLRIGGHAGVSDAALFGWRRSENRPVTGMIVLTEQQKCMDIMYRSPTPYNYLEHFNM